MKYSAILLVLLLVSCNLREFTSVDDEYKISSPSRLSELKFDRDTGRINVGGKFNIKVCDGKNKEVCLLELSQIWEKISSDLIYFKGDTMEEILHYQGYDFWFVSIVDLKSFPLSEEQTIKSLAVIEKSNLDALGNGNFSGLFHSEKYDLVKVVIRVEDWIFNEPEIQQILPANSIPPRPVGRSN